MTIERRARWWVELRDELYAANLLPSFMDHASRWRHVLSELQHTFIYRHNDTVHDIQPESWDDECNTGAAFLEHRRVWLGVMTELLRRPVTPSHVEQRRVWLDVMAELLLHRPVTPSHVEHRRVWLGVMTELLRRPVTPSHDYVSPLQRRRRRVLAPLRLTCRIRRNMMPCQIRRNLLSAFNNAT